MDAQINQQQVQLKYFSVLRPWMDCGDIPVHVADRAKELKTGAPVQILDAAGTVILTTKVYFISPQVDISTQSVLAKAPVDQRADRLRSQQLVRARITWSTQPGITIPGGRGIAH